MKNIAAIMLAVAVALSEGVAMAKKSDEAGARAEKANENLHNAKRNKKDEFYTQYEDIQKELNHYTEHFEGKSVFCNCDDPFESNFCKFFLRNFNYLGLKRLICTSYSGSPVIGSQMLLLDENDKPLVPQHGYVIDISAIPMKNGRGVSDADIDALLKSKKRGVKKLNGDGDFRSAECVEYLKEADIVVTNPPFSLFREYVAQLIEYDKKFLIIGNVNAITYKEVFPLIKSGKMWLGPSISSGDRKFNVPKDYPLEAAGCGVDDKGRKFIRVKGVRWFTNLDHNKRHEKLILYRNYRGSEDEYPKYDNYDAIEVSKVKEIPQDYDGVMGVPITFLDKHNPDQFEILEMLSSAGGGCLGTYPPNQYGQTVKDKRPLINNKNCYARILIRKRKAGGGNDSN